MRRWVKMNNSKDWRKFDNRILVWYPDCLRIEKLYCNLYVGTECWTSHNARTVPAFCYRGIHAVHILNISKGFRNIPETLQKGLQEGFRHITITYQHVFWKKKVDILLSQKCCRGFRNILKYLNFHMKSF